MPTIRAALRRFLLEETGQDTVEWSLLAGFISVASVVTLKSIGPLLFRLYTKIAAGIALAGGRS